MDEIHSVLHEIPRSVKWQTSKWHVLKLLAIKAHYREIGTAQSVIEEVFSAAGQEKLCHWMVVL